MKKLLKKIVSIAMVGVLMISSIGCSNGNSGDGDEVDIKVGIVADGAGFGSQSFNDIALTGTKKATDEFGIELLQMEVKEESDKANTLRTLVGQGVNLFIIPGSGMLDAVKEVAQEYPDAKFAVLDTGIEGVDNITSAEYREHEAAFLLGSLGALLTETKKLGFIGGIRGEIQDRFEYGYKAGAQYIDPSIEVISSYTGTFNDVGKGKEIANMMYKQGIDYIAPTAGACNLGVFQAANEANMKCFGAADGQFHNMPDNILASQVKYIDNVAYTVIKDLVNGNFAGGQVKEYGIAEDGVGLLYTSNEELLKVVPDEVKEQIKEIEEQIKSGEIIVPKNEQEFNQ